MDTCVECSANEVNIWQEDARAVAALLRQHRGSDIYAVARDYYLARGFSELDADQCGCILEADWDLFAAPRSTLRKSPHDDRAAKEWVRWQHHLAARHACQRQAQQAQASLAPARATGARTRARRSPAARQRRSTSSGGGGESSDGGDPDPEPRRHSEYVILDYQRLAERWHCSPRSLANQFCSRPDSLPASISIPGVRGPRWRLADVEAFESHLRQRPDPPPRKRGRPRIAGGRA